MLYPRAFVLYPLEPAKEEKLLLCVLVLIELPIILKKHCFCGRISWYRGHQGSSPSSSQFLLDLTRIKRSSLRNVNRDSRRLFIYYQRTVASRLLYCVFPLIHHRTAAGAACVGRHHNNNAVI